MGSLDILEDLFLIRHAAYYAADKTNVEHITKEGKKALGRTIDFIIMRMNPHAIATLASSTSRRAIETALHIGDNIDGYMSQSLQTFPSLRLRSGVEIAYRDLNAALRQSPQAIIVAHEEMVNELPAYILRKRFGKKDVRTDFGAEYGRGAYINLKAGEVERI